MGLFDGITLYTEHCCSCHAPIYMTNELQARLRRTGEVFYCMAGHKQWYGGSEVDRLQKELAAKEKALAAMSKDKEYYLDLNNRKNRAIQQRDHVIRTLKGNVTKLRKKLKSEPSS